MSIPKRDTKYLVQRKIKGLSGKKSWETLYETENEEEANQKFEELREQEPESRFRLEIKTNPPFDQYPDDLLQKIGEAVCSTDYAVRFFNNPNHKKFYHERRELLRSLRRAWQTGAFDHKERILKILKRWEEENGKP